MTKENSVIEELAELKEQALSKISDSASLADLEEIRLAYLGRKGEVTSRLKSLGKLPPDLRPSAGQELNRVKRAIDEEITGRKESLQQKELNDRLVNESFDISQPGRHKSLGVFHPVAGIMEELIDIFTRLGFVVVEGPEVETDEFNFKKLNFPDDHPARDMQDTFYVKNGAKLLRTHTSPVQIHAMLKRNPPMSIIAPGRVYRCDSDVTHSPVFHQIEGFHIDKNVTMAHLKGTLELFVHRLYGKNTGIRLRPSFFPFTEPSAEVDISCMLCKGKGCRLCKGTGWIEILGAGMIDPNVLKEVDIDPEKWTGFAFGIGIERVAMLKYAIDDIRLLFENDPEFLRQF